MPAGPEDDETQAARDVANAGIGKGDCLIALSASGTTPYAVAALKAAKAAGAATIGIANNEGAPLLGLADIAILLPTPPELIAGSTRMGAATAQKIALNMMSTLMAIHLGHVHDGYMVNLHADNMKLQIARGAHRRRHLAAAATTKPRAYLEAERRLGEGRGAACRRRRRPRRREAPARRRRSEPAQGAGKARRERPRSVDWELETVNDPTGRTGKMTTNHTEMALLMASSILASAGYASADDTTLTIESWRNDDLAIWQDKIIPAFEAKNPGIKVDVRADGADRIQRRARTPSSTPARRAT